MEKDLIAHLLGEAAITDLCSERITPGWRTQGAPVPAVTINVASRTPDYHMAGASGLDDYRVQIDVWAATYAAAKDLSGAIVARISGYRGVVGETRFDGVFLNNERDLSEMDAPERLHRVSLDFNLWAAMAS